MADRTNEFELRSIKNDSSEDEKQANVMDPASSKVEGNKEKPTRRESVEDRQNQKTLEHIKEHLNLVLLGIAVFGIILSIVGTTLPKNEYITFNQTEIVKDYTDCTAFVPDTIVSGANQTKCKDYLNSTQKECICSMLIEIKKPMIAPVTAFYELDAYEQISGNYSKSRDDKQLAGDLSSEPSESCGSYTYACVNETAGRKPIAPCGRLADAMFTDAFSFHINNSYVPCYSRGLVSEDYKKRFRNPAGNLPEVFSNFSKPLHWMKNVWEFNISNPLNNGFQNERFIVWMKTDLKRKPACQVYHTGIYEKGLPVGNYTLNVIYGYPTPSFGGRRRFILSSLDGSEIVQDYTDCEDLTKKLCKDVLNETGKGCTCYIGLEITKPMAAPVTVSYELDAYDQITRSYSKSRDDKQLAGDLSLEPSESCGSYTYACVDETSGRKPIAPCGRLADAMFTDTFSLETNNTSVPYFRYGLISEDEKKPFHNPKSTGNLSQVFKNFSKPMSWRQNIWELDDSNPDNNGFQNEAFIIWMKADLKRKPAWRVNHTGLFEKELPAANYTLNVKYVYPTPRFGGRRRFIISSKQKNVSLGKNKVGVTLLVIGLLSSILASCLLLYRNRSVVINWFRALTQQ